MYIHIGSNRMIRAVDIVGIFDLDGQITTEDTKRFLRRVDSEGHATLAGDDLPRSAVLVCAKHNDRGGAKSGADKRSADKRSADKSEGADTAADSIIYSRLTTQALVRRAEE